MRANVLYLIFLFNLNKPLEDSSSSSSRTPPQNLPYRAEQVHLSLGLSSSEVYVTWATLKEVSRSVLEYRVYFEANGTYGPTIRNEDVQVSNWQSNEQEELDLSQAGSLEELISRSEREESKIREHYTYRAKMEGLQAGFWYEYSISSYRAGEVSTMLVRGDTFSFFARDFQSNPRRSLKLALYGDLGLLNGQSIDRLTSMVEANAFDMVIHNGDFAYDLDRDQGRHGDQFMRKIEPIASRVPYQTSVGNHEAKEKFLHYDQRFTMLNSASVSDYYNLRNNFYYSFNAGPIHFVAISTEFYYFVDYIGVDFLQRQFEFLEEDLKFANSAAERAQRPWIVVFGHRPMYCSSNDHDDCTTEADIIRVGLAKSKQYGLEKVFYEHGVDVLFWSHEHQYERFLPLFNNSVINGTDQPRDPYFNPRAPVHLISGSAGCEERIDDFRPNVAPGSVVRIADYGFTQLTASLQRLIFEQISDDKDGTIVDTFTITKTKQNFPRENPNSVLVISQESCQTLNCEYLGSLIPFCAKCSFPRQQPMETIEI